MQRVVTLGLVLGLVAAGSVVLAKERGKSTTPQTQIAHTFANGEAGPVHGLQIELSGAAEVKTDESTGQAGPFRNVSGNGTKTLVLGNPTAPIEPGAAGFDLVFRTEAKKLAVDSWWWTDAKGKRVGDKHKD